tara:strand:+ start:932 stop:1144 length:213 start_codon:yes stop_codon:yes gene_type:complete
MEGSFVKKHVSPYDRWCYVTVKRGGNVTHDRIKLEPTDTRDVILKTLLGVYGDGDIIWKQTGWGCDYVCK